MRRLFWRIYATYLIVVLLATAAVGVLTIRSAREFYLDHTRSELQSRAALVREEVAPLAGTRASEIEPLVRRLGSASSTRVTIIAVDEPGEARGVVIAESETPPEEMENHSDRPEFKTAADGGVGSSIRYSHTLNEDMMYVAVPLENAGRVEAVVRVAMPLTAVNEALGSLYRSIALAAVAVALAAAVIGWFVSSRISRPMHEVRDGAARFAAGDFGGKLAVPRTEEFAAVAESLNTMAEQLDEKIRAITRERNEREAVLASMVEGVVAVDPEGRVIALNDAAARLLQLDATDVRGRAIEEVARDPELQRVIADALAGQAPTETDLTAYLGHEERFLQAHGARLHAGDEGVGALVVLNDVTRLRRLEAVRRDFVANVSHELKTPVTSIKGFVETLLDGALDDPDVAPRFLRIIAGQADRLNSIIEDLLALSSLEGANDGLGPPLLEAALGDVLHAAADVCAPRAEARRARIVVDAPGELMVRMNPALLEQAVVNLIDNAVKYGPEGGTVRVGADTLAGEPVVSVADEGPGIPREHLPRLFERFYRIDKARSRDMGGTGLGLAIVKHIAQVHGGRVTVESAVGGGSVFRLHLPRP